MENTHLNKPESLNKPLVTVAMVTYNSAAYVEAAINSILASSYTNFELLIADDQSTDNTWDLIIKYQDTRIKAWRNGTNLGEYKNRNECIKLAKGEYFIFIDGDDILFEHGLSNYVYYAEKYPEAPLIIQKGYTNNVIFPIVLTARKIFEFEFFGNSLLTSSFVSNFFRTNILKDEGGLSEIYRAGDNYIRYRLASKYPILFISGWNSWHRETPGQASVVIRNGVGLAEHFKLVKEFIKLKSIPLSLNESNYILNLYRYYLTRLLIKNRLKFNNKAFKKIIAIAEFSINDYVFTKPKKPVNYTPNYSPGQPLSKLYDYHNRL